MADMSSRIEMHLQRMHDQKRREAFQLMVHVEEAARERVAKAQSSEEAAIHRQETTTDELEESQLLLVSATESASELIHCERRASSSEIAERSDRRVAVNTAKM